MKEREEIRKEKYRLIREKQKAKLDKRKAYLIRYEQRYDRHDYINASLNWLVCLYVRL